MKLLSKACVYGIQAALLLVARHDREKYVPIRRVSEELGISFYFLTKILQTLTQNGILVSYRGPNGGVALAKSPREISVMDVIRAIDHEDTFETCVLGLPGCGTEKPCPFHASWWEARNRIADLFANANLEELGQRVKDEGFRIAT